MTQPRNLRQQAEEFGQEVDRLLSATLPGLSQPVVEISHRQDRFIIHPPEVGNRRHLPLYVDGKRLASMKLSYSCELDSVGHYLAIWESRTAASAGDAGRWPLLSAMRLTRPLG